MKNVLLLFLFFPFILFAQKKPLDHTVYDAWQSIGERHISNNGKWVVYTITPQEGDATLLIQSADNPSIKREVARGYNAVITDDSRFVVFRIKPHFKETREARIRKKRIEDMPKDSVAIVELGKAEMIKLPKARSYKVPEKAGGWVAVHKERDPLSVRPSTQPTQRTVDSLRQKIDSLTLLVVQLKNTKSGSGDKLNADEEPSASAAGAEGSDLVVRNLITGKERTFKNVSDYAFSKYGQKLVMRLAKAQRDSNSKAGVVIFDTQREAIDTILRGGNDFGGFAFSEDGNRLAFVAERDTNTKALQKFYGLYVYQPGSDTAQLLLDKMSVGMPVGMTISEHGTISFSKSGRRLLFGAAPVQPPKDTTLVDFELAKLDVWHYKDDYLQTQQRYNLQNELKRSYLTLFDFRQNKVVPLGSAGLPTVLAAGEGDGRLFAGVTDTGRRVALQWTGNTIKDVYAIDPETGARTLVKKNFDGYAFASAGGNYLLLYDNVLKQYLTWDGKNLRNISSKITTSLANEENDMPAHPNPYGIMGWHQDDSAVYVYDRYDVWKLDPTGKADPQKLTQIAGQDGRKAKASYRMLRLDDDERFIKTSQPIYFRLFNEENKKSAIVSFLPKLPVAAVSFITNHGDYAYPVVNKAKTAEKFLFTKESYQQSNVYLAPHTTGATAKPAGHAGALQEVALTNLNPQQSQYNWGTAELFKWTAFNGKGAMGILYKPENFNPVKQYPMIIYFYEKLSDGLHNYIAPEPTRSRLNIPFFVSRGYLVFAPDISYTKGHPGKDAYTYVVSGAQALAKKPWVDGKNIGIQGQSWGGYQVAYLITATNMFKAAWAGAPVVNMFSAYGGIRWESGLNRQFQYEKSQSRIGATPWERSDLYIENSPLFHFKKVSTPLVVMANDADGAVPWYQGIEAFTALRRLGKQVWLLNYNGEAHNLLERRNKKDIQIREQQFFDWLLKGEKPAKWLTEGVPAVKKGRDWGLGY
jgi:dipeptidyl aminopeptidase/acylaminoacyl peptidase